MTQFVEQLRNQAKWYTQPGHNARDLLDSRLLEKAADEIECLRAKIEAMEKQEPVAHVWRCDNGHIHGPCESELRMGQQLYALPGAQIKYDCGEAGHDEGRCGNAQCLPSAKGEEK